MKKKYLKNYFPSKFVSIRSGYMFLYLAKSRAKSMRKLHKRYNKEIGTFIKIFFLNQRKQKHLHWLQTTTLIEFNMFQV